MRALFNNPTSNTPPRFLLLDLNEGKENDNEENGKERRKEGGSGKRGDNSEPPARICRKKTRRLKSAFILYTLEKSTTERVPQRKGN